MRASQREYRKANRQPIQMLRHDGDDILTINANQMTRDEIKRWLTDCDRSILERIVYEAIIAARRR